MIAFLRPGDRIHLAFPMPSGSVLDSQRQAEKDAAHFAASYARHGVVVDFWSANSLLTHPVVVAVFRTEQVN